MDNGNEVKDIEEVTKDVFLQEADRIRAEKPRLYDMEHEFARTRRNRSPLIYFALAAFVVVAVVAAVLLTLHYDRRNRSVPVDIADFEDVNLKDLLSSAAKNANDLDSARQSLADAEQELAVKREALKGDLAGKVAVLVAQALPPAKLAIEQRALQDQEAEAERALDAQYAPRIAELNAEVDAAQKRAQSYNQAQLVAARKQEQVLNNEQRLRQMELERTKSYYEGRLKDLTAQHEREMTALRDSQARVVKAMDETKKREIAAVVLTYNPVIATDPLKRILSSPMADLPPPGLPALSVQLRAARLASDDALASLQDGSQKRLLVAARLREIPYRNSVPSALAHLDWLDRSLMKSYEDVAGALLQRVHDDELVIAQDRSAFQYYARKIRENGFLVDASDPQRIVPFLNPSYAVADGDLGLVFRADDEYIGTIGFAVSGTHVSARTVELAPGKSFEPFDKFLVKKKEGK